LTSTSNAGDRPLVALVNGAGLPGEDLAQLDGPTADTHDRFACGIDAEGRVTGDGEQATGEEAG
jgi:hypothetical protein